MDAYFQEAMHNRRTSIRKDHLSTINATIRDQSGARYPVKINNISCDGIKILIDKTIVSYESGDRLLLELDIMGNLTLSIKSVIKYIDNRAEAAGQAYGLLFENISNDDRIRLDELIQNGRINDVYRIPFAHTAQANES